MVKFKIMFVCFCKVRLHSACPTAKRVKTASSLSGINTNFSRCFQGLKILHHFPLHLCKQLEPILLLFN